MGLCSGFITPDLDNWKGLRMSVSKVTELFLLGHTGDPAITYND
jgi:hypothetical protein